MSGRSLKVPQRAAGERLDVYAAAVTGLTRSHIQRLAKAGLIHVNGRAERTSYGVATGDIVTVEEAAPAAPAPVPRAVDLPIVFEDGEVLVIDKPAGIAVHGGAGRPGELTVADFARSHTTDPDPERPGIVHRLDRDTSGLLVIAKSEAAKQALQRQWKQRTVHKTYQLLTIGRVNPQTAIIDLPLDRDPTKPLQRAVRTGGKPARTKYRTLATYPGYTYIEATPETGRTHQLRVHFAALGHPIVGDTVYGAPARDIGLKRQFLHACGLQFTTPSGQVVSLTSDLPPDLKSVLYRLSHL